MCSIEFAGDDVVEELLPVGLGDDFDLKTLCFKEAFFFGNDDGGTIGKFDEAEFEGVFLKSEGGSA